MKNLFFLCLSVVFLSSCIRNKYKGDGLVVKSEKEILKEFENINSGIKSYQQTLDNIVSVYNLESLRRTKNNIRIHFKINDDGKLILIEVLESCGNSRIDNAVANSIKTLEPFDFFTAGARNNFKNGGLVFRYSLENRKILLEGSEPFDNEELRLNEKIGISKEGIDETVKAHYPELEECYKQAKKRNDSLTGKLALGWTIVSGGAVKGGRVIENKTGDQPLAECFLSKLNTFKFPAPSKGATAEVEYYPFSLK